MNISKEAKLLMQVGFVNVNDVNKVPRIVDECKSAGVDVYFKGKLGNQYCLMMTKQDKGNI